LLADARAINNEWCNTQSKVITNTLYNITIFLTHFGAKAFNRINRVMVS